MKRGLQSQNRFEAPSYRPASDGNFFDENGNTVDINGNLIREAPSPELLKARELYPNFTDEERRLYIIPQLKKKGTKHVN